LSVIHIYFMRENYIFDKSDSILLFKPYLELGVQMQQP
jgi:hypothetical protein